MPILSRTSRTDANLLAGPLPSTCKPGPWKPRKSSFPLAVSSPWHSMQTVFFGTKTMMSAVFPRRTDPSNSSLPPPSQAISSRVPGFPITVRVPPSSRQTASERTAAKIQRLLRIKCLPSPQVPLLCRPVPVSSYKYYFLPLSFLHLTHKH